MVTLSFYIGFMTAMGWEGKKDKGRQERVLFYRDYIKSDAWELRKQQYYSRHAKACYICGDTDRVELNHKKYGNYGHERDIDLVPLCRMHHQIITDGHKTRKNMRYQHDYMIDELKREWDAEHEGKPMLPKAQAVKESNGRSFAKLLDKTARPIWWMVHKVLMQK